MRENPSQNRSLTAIDGAMVLIVYGGIVFCAVLSGAWFKGEA